MPLSIPPMVFLISLSLSAGNLANVTQADDHLKILCQAHFNALSAYRQEYQARWESYHAGTDPITFVLDAQRHMIGSELSYLDCLETSARGTPFLKLVQKGARVRRSEMFATEIRRARTLIKAVGQKGNQQDLSQAKGQYQSLLRLRDTHMYNQPF